MINGKAYVGAGIRNANEHGVVSGYSYDPVADSWTPIADYPGNPSIGLCTFVIDSLGYAGIGSDGNGNYFNDMFKYSPATNSWTRIASFPAKARYIDLSCFAVNGKGYAGAGQTILNGIAANAYALGDYYMYDPAGNTWVSAPGLQGPPRSAATAFSFGDSAYLVGGENNDGYAIYRFVDEFKPIGMTCTAYDTARIYDTTHISVNDTLFITITVGIAPNTTLNTLDVYPNPGHNQIYINTGNYASMSGYTLNITNTLGQSVFSSSVNRQLFAISTSTWSPGVYFLQVINPNSTVATAKEIVVQ